MTGRRVPTGTLDVELRVTVEDGRLHLTAWKYSAATGRFEQTAALPPVVPAYGEVLAEAVAAESDAALWDALFDDATKAIEAGAT